MKTSLFFLLAAAALVLTACTSAPSSSAAPDPTPEPVPAVESAATSEASGPAEESAAPADLYAGYVQDFPDAGTMARPVETDDNRTLTLECALNNEIDQLIYDYYRNELLGDLDASLALVGDTESFRMTVENSVKAVQAGEGCQSYTLHGMRILTPEEVQTAGQNDLDLIAREVADSGLTQWTVQAVDLSWTYTEAEQAKGPQLDEGQYRRYFLLGKTDEADSWKIYDFFWETFLPEDAA